MAVRTVPSLPLRITPALCQRCGACCSAVVDGELVACRHLDTAGGSFRCRIYATRPPVCRDFDCLRAGEPSPAIAERLNAALAIEQATSLRHTELLSNDQTPRALRSA